MRWIELRIVNQEAALDRVRQWVERFAADRALPDEVHADLQVSLDEVLANIIAYAYSDDAEHEIRIRLGAANGVLEAEVEDDGRPFDPLGQPTSSLRGGIADRDVGGLGVHFIRALNDEIRYVRAEGRNRLMLRRYMVEKA